jgi:hypothetical protein
MNNTYIEIPTHKHTSRFAVNLLWFCICLFFTGIGIYGTIMKFKWEYLLVDAVVIVGLIYYGDAVWAYLNFTKLTIRVSKDENKAVFSGIDEKGEKFFDDQFMDMKKVARAYYRITRVKVLKFKSIEFQLNNAEKTSEEMYFIPDSHDVLEEDVYKILDFLKVTFPHIELGFEGDN